MALTNDQQRRVYLHVGVSQASLVGGLVGGVPMLTEANNALQVGIESLTANGETSVIELLTTLDAQRTALLAGSSKAGISSVASGESTVTFSGKTFSDLRELYDWTRRELMTVLGYDPAAFASSDSAGDAQGPWREP